MAVSRPGCTVARPLWVSKPPIETKKTCRFAPTASAVLIMRATSLSWSARLLVPGAGNGVLIVGPPASAVVSVPPALSERAVMRVYSFSKMLALPAVTRSCKAVEHAAEPNSGLATPLSATGPLVDTWYCVAVLPDR